MHDDDGRVDEEVTALTSIFEALEVGADGRSVAGTWLPLRVRVAFPAGYPRTVAAVPTVNVAPLASRAAVAPAQLAALREELAKAAVDHVGDEAGFALLQIVADHAEELASQARRTPEDAADAAAASAAGGPTPASGVASVVRVVHIDHMRRSKAYLRHLQDFTRASGVASCVAFVPASEAPSAGAMMSNVVVVLVGSTAATASWLQMLRTTVGVDVNARGRPCREKKATELCCVPCPPAAALHDGGAFDVVQVADAGDVARRWDALALGGHLPMPKPPSWRK